MKGVSSWKRQRHLAMVSIFLITVALIAGMVSCGGEQEPEIPEYNLTISSTEGGSVTTPGEGPSTRDEGEEVNLVAEAEEGYEFANWTGDVTTIGDVNDATTTITMEDNYSITAEFAVKQYSLVIHSTDGGSVTTPGENAYACDKGEVVNLVAVADEGYQFMNWTGDVSTIADAKAASTTITMNSGYPITANFAKEILDWHGLHAIGDNLGGSYVLMNDLGSTIDGYTELASPTANEGQGWEPIATFTGSFDGQGYEIRDLFIGRADEGSVGLFGCVQMGIIENLGVLNAEVTGQGYVGGLVGLNGGTVSGSYLTGDVTGESVVGGVVGENSHGTVSNCHSTGDVTGESVVGGVVGENLNGTVSNCHSTGGVTGGAHVGGVVGAVHGGTVSNSYSTSSVTGDIAGGLVGSNHGTVSNSYSTGNVNGKWLLHGLVGDNHRKVSNSYYNYDEVLINGENIITVGALFGEDFEQWLADDKFLDVDERLSQEGGYYLISDVSDFKQLLAFGQDGSLRFRLRNDLNLGDEPNFYVPYLAGEFDGNGHKISNLSFNFDFISQVGLFGYLASGGKLTEVSAENVNVTGGAVVGSLVGENDGTVINSYSTGRVAARESVGGLVGLMGWSEGTVSNSYYNYDEVLINGRNIITIGALFDEDFDQWLANDKFLDVDETLSQEDGYYLINGVSDFKQLLAFAQDDSLKFRLENDLDLAAEPDFYIPYLAGEFDGNGHKISNLSFDFGFAAQVGLFGYLALGGEVSEVGVENVNISGDQRVGGLVGGSVGTVSKSYSTGSVTGESNVGGLVGYNAGYVSNSCSSGSVTGDWGVGGLVGWNKWVPTAVRNSYSTGSVTSSEGEVGGLVGSNLGAVSNSFWDTETSGQSTSGGGTGKTTAEMRDIATFSGALWNIIAVAPGERNTAYTWNIVVGESYPFLSWQSVS